MAQVRYIQPDGIERVIDVKAGESLMQAAVENGVDGIVAECGGACMCATCHVYVDDQDLARLAPVEATEDEMLEATAAERRSNSRLSCQLKAGPDLDGITVRIAPEQI